MKFRGRQKGMRRVMTVGSHWLEERGTVGADRQMKKETECSVDILVNLSPVKAHL